MRGVLVINKPKGITSHMVISKLRYLLGERKIGHCGTLDPMASGILPIMVGTAVKASEYLMDHDKRYIAGIKLGITTETEDITGEITSTHVGELPDFESFSKTAKEFEGEIMQIPPMYSALKVGGIKLLNLAREGITVERQERAVNIYSCHPFERDGEFYLDVKCSKGTYIRTLCADIGRELGCGAVMSSLDRVEVGSFTKDDAVEFDSLGGMTRDEIIERIIPIERMFNHLPTARLTDFFERLYKQGQHIEVRKLRAIKPEQGTLWRIYDENGFHSLGEVHERDGKLYFHMKKLF